MRWHQFRKQPSLGDALPNSYFQIDRQKGLRDRVRKQNFKMAPMVAIMFLSKWHQPRKQPSLCDALNTHVNFQIDQQKHLQVRD